MRITNNMLINNMSGYLNNNLNRMSKYQSQLATGKKIQVPSDDPVVAARALKLRTDVSEIAQYKKNVEDGMSWLETTEDALAQVGDILQRARELAVQAKNGTNTPDDMQKIEEEIKQLKNQLIDKANTTHAGRYVFSGYSTNKELMDENGCFAIDVPDTEEIKYEIGVGDSIEVNVCGGEVFNMGGTATAGDSGSLIKTFDDFIDALDNGDYDAIDDIINGIDDNFENVLRVRADIGARTNRLELTLNRHENDNINFTKLMSNNEDVDVAEVIMNLKSEENVYRASLAGGSRIIMPTLVDFLK